jgi:hypothetical protein
MEAANGSLKNVAQALELIKAYINIHETSSTLLKEVVTLLEQTVDLLSKET